MKKHNYPLLSYESILKILNDDEQEIIKMLHLYEGFINYYSTRFCYDQNGRIYKRFDEDKSQYIKLKILKALKKFNK